MGPVSWRIHYAAAQVNAKLAKRAHDRHWHGAAPVLAGAAALATLPLFLGRVQWAAFLALSVAAAGIWAVHGPLLSWPAVILSGTNAASGVIHCTRFTTLKSVSSTVNPKAHCRGREVRGPCCPGRRSSCRAPTQPRVIQGSSFRSAGFGVPPHLLCTSCSDVSCARMCPWAPDVLPGGHPARHQRSLR